MRHLRTIPEKGLLIVWEWTSHSEDEDDDDSDYHDGNSQSSDEEPLQTCVEFKCIGVTRDPVYQTLLGDVPFLVMYEIRCSQVVLYQ